jgi:hypothetical protein
MMCYLTSDVAVAPHHSRSRMTQGRASNALDLTYETSQYRDHRAR